MTSLSNNRSALIPSDAALRSNNNARQRLPSRFFWSEVPGSSHFVQFYEEDEFLLDSLSAFIGKGLGSGEGCVVIATQDHRAKLEAHLQANNLNLATACAQDQYISLDAEETLAQLIKDGKVEPERFTEILGKIITRAARGQRHVRAFGEMVALQWAEGNHAATIRLEALWNDLIYTTPPFTLFCAYPIRYFAKEEDGAQLREICQQHAHVIPDESYTMLADQDERLRAITLWQQKAHALEAEITERKNIEERLRISENRYRRLFEAASDGVLIIDPRTGTIIDANPSLGILVGYSPEQMQGQHLWQIGLFADQQATQNALREMRIQRMLRYETMPLHLKNGERRYVDFVSTLFQSNGHSVIQCTLRDITARKRAEEALQQSKSTLQASQEQLRIALAASSTGTFRWNPFTGIFLEFDANLKQLFGFPLDEQVRVTEDLLVRVHPHDVPALILTVARCRQGADFEMEYRVIHPDGSVHWLYNRAKIERDEQGKPLYLVGACTDITQRKQMEEALRESVEHLRLMAESMPQKIFTAKPNGDVDYFNPQWIEFTGLSLEEIKGWGWLQFIHPYDVEENVNRWQHSIETGEPFSYEHRFRRADGVYRWHLSRAIPVRDAQGHITMWIGTNTDITEQKELVYQKEALVSMATHELRTPLTSMKGYMQLAERRLRQIVQSPQIAQEEQKTMLDQVLLMLSRSQQQLDIQNRLITDLLDTSRMQEGTLELHLTSCDLGHLVRNTVENYQAVYPHRQIMLDLPEQAGLTVQIDSDRIVQVLSNYLTNALKYSADDKAVQVGMAYEPPMARIWVTDQGPGLSQEVQQHIWERFYRAPGIVAQNHTGASLGLGLSICQGIVQSHHGQVGVESTPEQGAQFWFTLPLLEKASILE